MPITKSQEVEARCTQFQHETGVRISKEAQELLVDLVKAITLDPHPSWIANAQELEQGSERFLREVILRLNEIRIPEGAPRIITTYQLLHWLGENLDSLCPISKRGRQAANE